jgi:hypothetical protein
LELVSTLQLVSALQLVSTLQLVSAPVCGSWRGSRFAMASNFSLHFSRPVGALGLSGNVLLLRSLGKMHVRGVDWREAVPADDT